MSVSEDDVRHVAALARLGVDPAELPALAAELDGILRHMRVLAKVNTRNVAPVAGVGAGGTPLRADGGPQLPLAAARESFAPSMRDGFFLVPRLATHADHGASADAGDPAESAAAGARGAGHDDQPPARPA